MSQEATNPRGSMTDPSRPEVSELLQRWNGGDETALERLMPLVYDELRGVAARYLQAERPGHTLQPTALVHEAYMRLVGQDHVVWQNRAHFFAIAAQMMRRVLVDHARRKKAAKRDAATFRIEMAEKEAGSAGDRDPEILDLDEALKGLEALDPRQARIVELRFFGGLTVEETAEIAGLSPATVKREWRTARAWLRQELESEGEGS
jgi:RNA polymerase sigma factor (TIGR02999 family)